MTSETPPPQSQPGTPDPNVAREIAALQRENNELRTKLDRIEKRAELAAAGRKRAWRFTWRVLVPLLDRKKVVRNFNKLASTTAEFVGPPEQWPSRERVLNDANDFMTSVVRFIIRRRMFFILFTIIATSIPFLQVYLVLQQNSLISKTNELFQVQINDMIARAMTDDDDPNTRRMAVALLANAKIELMGGVVKEIFDPEVALDLRLGSETSKRTVRKQLKEAGFRAHLMRAVARAVHNRGAKDDADELYEDTYKMFQQVLEDTAPRLLLLMNVTPEEANSVKSELLKEADYYVFHVGYVLRQYGRLTRKVGKNRRFYRDITELLQNMAYADVRGSYFKKIYHAAMEDFLIDLGERARLGSKPVKLPEDMDPDAIKRAGFDRLKKGVGEDALDWKRLAQQLRVK